MHEQQACHVLIRLNAFDGSRTHRVDGVRNNNESLPRRIVQHSGVGRFGESDLPQSRHLDGGFSSQHAQDDLVHQVVVRQKARAAHARSPPAD